MVSVESAPDFAPVSSATPVFPVVSGVVRILPGLLDWCVRVWGGEAETSRRFRSIMEYASDSSLNGSYARPDCPGVATYFAPAGRDTADQLARATAAVAQVPLLAETLNAMPHMVMVLNARRQIVAANEALLNILEVPAGKVLGKRPGEAVECIRALEGPDGCGTARHCATCGAAEAVLASQETGRKVVRECRILARTAGGPVPMDLRVTATPFCLEGECFTVAAVEDIGPSKRLAVLQRTFFHDVLNTAGCIQGYTRFLSREASAADATVCRRLASLAEQIVAEIQTQRDLLAAESGDYQVQPELVPARQVLEELCVRYSRHPVAEGRVLAMGPCWDGAVISDQSLLLRVLGNMVKNGLEATPSGGVVTIACADGGDEVAFTVHNTAVMPEEVQLQVFQRSFSTKGESGRGVGTYSMKLFGERYLGGKVGFTSDEARGTTFRLTLPKNSDMSLS